MTDAITPTSPYGLLKFKIKPGTRSLKLYNCPEGTLAKGSIPESVTSLALMQLADVVVKPGAITEAVKYLLIKGAKDVPLPQTVKYLFLDNCSVRSEAFKNVFEVIGPKDWTLGPSRAGMFNYGSPVPKWFMDDEKYEYGVQTRVDFGGEVIYYVKRKLRPQAEKPTRINNLRSIPKPDPKPSDSDIIANKIVEAFTYHWLDGLTRRQKFKDILFNFEQKFPAEMDTSEVAAKVKAHLPNAKIQVGVRKEIKGQREVFAWVDAHDAFAHLRSRHNTSATSESEPQELIL